MFAKRSEKRRVFHRFKRGFDASFERVARTLPKGKTNLAANNADVAIQLALPD